MRREAGWLVSNISIFLAGMVLLLGLQASAMLATSPDGSIGGGWGGPAISQILGWILLGGWIATFFSPVLAAVLVVYRVTVELLGRPRLVAVTMATLVTAILTAMTGTPDTTAITALAISSLGYAAILLVPGRTLGGLRPMVRGVVAGLALSCIWLVGSVTALVLAAVRMNKGQQTEAVVLATAGTALPALTLFIDLFRPDVPAENYLVTGLLLAGFVAGSASALTRLTRRLVRA